MTAGVASVSTEYDPSITPASRCACNLRNAHQIRTITTPAISAAATSAKARKNNPTTARPAAMSVALTRPSQVLGIMPGGMRV
jgi:hypothetical protein